MAERGKQNLPKMQQYWAEHPDELRENSRKANAATQKYYSKNPERMVIRTARAIEGFRKLRIEQPDRWQTVVAARSSARRGEPQNGRSAEGINNARAKVWHLRSPDNLQFSFRNLSEFVRTHTELFDDADLIWKRTGLCRAVQGISSISPACLRPKLSWKGWTWVSIHERRFNDGADLLQRKES